MTPNEIKLNNKQNTTTKTKNPASVCKRDCKCHKVPLVLDKHLSNIRAYAPEVTHVPINR